MKVVRLPVRYYKSPTEAAVDLDVAATALMVVDCDGVRGAARNEVIERNIAPALAAARGVGMRVFYFYEVA